MNRFESRYTFPIPQALCCGDSHGTVCLIDNLFYTITLHNKIENQNLGNSSYSCEHPANALCSPNPSALSAPYPPSTFKIIIYLQFENFCFLYLNRLMLFQETYRHWKYSSSDQSFNRYIKLIYRLNRRSVDQL